MSQLRQACHTLVSKNFSLLRAATLTPVQNKLFNSISAPHEKYITWLISCETFSSYQMESLSWFLSVRTEDLFESIISKIKTIRNSLLYINIYEIGILDTVETKLKLLLDFLKTNDRLVGGFLLIEGIIKLTFGNSDFRNLFSESYNIQQLSVNADEATQNWRSLKRIFESFCSTDFADLFTSNYLPTNREIFCETSESTFPLLSRSFLRLSSWVSEFFIKWITNNGVIFL